MKQQRSKSFRQIPGLSRTAEELQLEKIIELAQENLEKAEAYGLRLSDELHNLMETYGTKDKEALSLFHNAQARLRENRYDLLRCRKARKKPYFGRIDFRDPHIPFDESYYVGRTGISENGNDPIVIDWRAPVASVYYENTAGKCSYTVKNEGTCEIDLKRKRTYEIENDRLKDFYDSDIVANDELLTRYLARNKNAVLGEIIATIQAEQNAVIRRTPKMNLIVQGAAGSGKTTVAMHRISYILYNYEEDFRPEDFYIIGSNRILLNYITSVLPDLDVYGVSQMTMEQLFVRLLYEDWDPGTCRIRRIEKDEESVRIKGGSEWFRDLETYCRNMELSSIRAEDVRLDNGIVLMKKETVINCIENNPLVSMQGKINMLNAILISRLENETTGKEVQYPPHAKKELFRKYRRHFGGRVWKGSVYSVYEDFLDTQTAKGKSVPSPGNEFDLYDLAALAYIYKRIKETDGIREASHIIIDEAQDFGMMAYHSLYFCLRNCTYTIMGDVSQNIHFGYGLNDWEELKPLILGSTRGGFGILKKSYRNTVEISDFAAGILRHGSFAVYPADPVNRHGSPVRIFACPDTDQMISETIETVRQWQAGGRETIAVICRDEETARLLGSRLGSELTLANTDPDTAEFTEGIMILPVEYTKGLEFDAVLLYDPSETAYPSEDAYVKLLYVAATRALHELAVVHCGDLTRLIAGPVQNRHQKQLPEPPASDTSGKAKSSHQPIVPENSPKQKPSPAVKPVRLPPASGLHTNPSPYRFGSIPDSTLLTLGRTYARTACDLSVCSIKRTGHSLILVSGDGTLRLTPVKENVIRVQFTGKEQSSVSPGCWNMIPDPAPSWTAKAGSSLAELSTGQLRIQIDRRSGAIRFIDSMGKKLLTESRAVPRRIENGTPIRTWNYFDWLKEEKLSVKGILDEDLERINNKARYISFGGKNLRMPLIVSDFGYGLGVAAQETVMCCNVPVWGTYLYTEGSCQIDYYFLYGGNYRETLSLYKELQKSRFGRTGL